MNERKREKLCNDMNRAIEWEASYYVPAKSAAIAADAAVRALSGQVAPPVPPCPREGCGYWYSSGGYCSLMHANCLRDMDGDDCFEAAITPAPKRRGRK